MKKLGLTLGLALVSLLMNAQVFEVEGKSKDEIHSIINQWIAENYNSANNVIQMNDKEAGMFIVKGINSITYKNVSGKTMMPNNPYVTEYKTIDTKHTIKINIRDGKYKLKVDINEDYDMSIEDASETEKLIIREQWIDAPMVGKKKELRMIDASIEDVVLIKKELRDFISDKGMSISNYIAEFNTDGDW